VPRQRRGGSDARPIQGQPTPAYGHPSKEGIGKLPSWGVWCKYSALAGEEDGESQGGAVVFNGGWNDASSNGTNLGQYLLGKEAQALRREVIR